MKIDLGGWSWAAEMALDWGLPALATAFGVPGPVSAFAISKLKQVLGLKPSATDDDVRRTVEGMDPETARAALDSVQSEVVAKYDYLKTAVEVAGRVQERNITAVNKTMRAELGVVPWWHWRHLLGYVPVVMGTELCALMPLVVFGFIQVADMVAIISAVTPFMVVIAGLLGYVAADTTAWKQTVATGEAPPSLAGAIVKAVLPSKKK